MLARTAMALCLSVISRSSIETAERIELVSGMGAPFHPSYTLRQKETRVSQKCVLPCGTLSQTPDFDNTSELRHSTTEFIKSSSSVHSTILSRGSISDS